jgi:hypothetical protein
MDKSNNYNPLLRRLFKEPKIYINLLQSGELWHVDYANGAAKRVNTATDRVHDDHPFYYSDCKRIEMYLLFSFNQSGLEIRIDSSMKNRHVVRFSIPRIGTTH